MISFNKPSKLNGETLIAELIAANVEIKHDDLLPFNKKCPKIDGDGVLWLAIEESDRIKAQQVLDAHLG
jgi:hypothetical protein